MADAAMGYRVTIVLFLLACSPLLLAGAILIHARLSMRDGAPSADARAVVYDRQRDPYELIGTANFHVPDGEEWICVLDEVKPDGQPLPFDDEKRSMRVRGGEQFTVRLTRGESNRLLFWCEDLRGRDRIEFYSGPDR